MKQEIEVKFLNVAHDEIRKKLRTLGATCKQPMCLMRRAIIDYPDRRLQTGSADGWGWIRVRDEGDRVTCTYKHIANDDDDTTHEIEYEVSSYDKAVELFETIGLTKHAEQETKRETWEFNGVEIMLDAWPWLPEYIEVEGVDEAAIRTAAEALGMDWSDALRGSSDRAYRIYYPKMTFEESISDVGELTFSGELPKWLAERK